MQKKLLENNEGGEHCEGGGNCEGEGRGIVRGGGMVDVYDIWRLRYQRWCIWSVSVNIKVLHNDAALISL